MIAYVAGPYTANDQYGRGANCLAASKLADRLWEAGFTVICPHKNSYGSEDVCPTVDFHSRYKEMLERVDVVFLLERYKESPGTMDEIEHADLEGIPVVFPEFTTAAIEFFKAKGPTISPKAFHVFSREGAGGGQAVTERELQLNPGSPEAQEASCSCPVLSNNGGHGAAWVNSPPADGSPAAGYGRLFWIDGDCPLHGLNREGNDERQAETAC